MEKKLKIVIAIVLMALIILSSTAVLAENETVGTNVTIIGGNQTTTPNTTGNEQTTNTVIVGGNSTITQNTSLINTTTSYNNTDQTLPKTGETDIYVIALLIIVCTVSAIYAYRKIRDYNIK